MNYHCFSLTDTNYKELRAELWEQLESIRPEAYLADGDRLIFITSNRELFDLALSQNDLDTIDA